MSELILHVDALWESPYAFSSFVALEEKGLPFQVVEIDIEKGEQRAPAYADKSLTGRVPALVHGDFCLAESSAIDEYIEEAFPPPAHRRIYPAEIRARARARMVQAWLRSDLMPIREERSTWTVFYERAKEPLSEKGRAAAERLFRVAGALLPEGATALFGDFGVADADLTLMLERLIVNGDPVPERLRAYAAASWARQSIRRWVEHPRKR